MDRFSTILTQIWSITSTTVQPYITGSVYKKTRPVSSILEDCVISILPGTSAKFVQNGAVYIKIYFKDIAEDGTYYEDTENSATFEFLLYNLSIILLSLNSIVFDITSRELYTEPVKETNEHYCILKLNFKNH